jgi:hypothetical protein
LRKKCISCQATFRHDGKKRGAKYCPECRKRGKGRVWGFTASNPLIAKGAETAFEEAWVARLEHLQDREGPIALLGPDGELWRLWPRGEGPKETSASEARHWRLFAKGVINAMTPPPPRKAKALAARPKGFRVRLCIENEQELQILGCGWRIVTVELAGPKVHLHHNGNTATMKRKAFKDFLAANKRLRRKRPVLRLVVSNPPKATAVKEAAA